MARVRHNGMLLKNRATITPCDGCIATIVSLRILFPGLRMNPKAAFFNMEGKRFCHECYENWKKQ